MARIKILDLPLDIKISPEEKKKIYGGQTSPQVAQAFQMLTQIMKIGQDTNMVQQMIDKDKD